MEIKNTNKKIEVLGVELKPFDNTEIEGYTYRDYKIINKEIKEDE